MITWQYTKHLALVGYVKSEHVLRAVAVTRPKTRFSHVLVAAKIKRSCQITTD